MNVLETIDKLKIFLNKQINSLALTNPVISFSKPIIIRIVNNNRKYYQLYGLFEYAFQSDLRPHEWYQKNIKNML